MGTYTPIAFQARPTVRQFPRDWSMKNPNPCSTRGTLREKSVAVDLLNMIYSKSAFSFEFSLSIRHQPP